MTFCRPDLCCSLVAIAAHRRITAASGGSGSDSASLWIALAALVVSIALPLILDSRQTPRVRVRIQPVAVVTEENAFEYYQVSAINRGRSAVVVNKMQLSIRTKPDREETYLGLPSRQFPRGPQLPHQLDPYSDVSLAILKKDADELIGKRDGVRLYGSVSLSNGYRVWCRPPLHLDAKPGRIRRSKLWFRISRRILVRARID